MAEMARPRSAPRPVLQVRGLNVFYGHSHALQGVDLTLDHGVLSIVGRNGMGKTTLCKTIMGLVRAASGSIRLNGEEITRLAPAQIARLGIGYVPQGRRLWRSLTVDEHLRMTAGSRPRRVDDRAHLRHLSAARRAQGQRRRAALRRRAADARDLAARSSLNPRLLVMDEPTEGLAPVIVAQVEEMLVRLAEEGDVAVLVIEQNIGVATAVSERVAIMVNGRINRIIDSARARRRPRACSSACSASAGMAMRTSRSSGRRRGGSARTLPPAPSRARGPTRIYVSNPVAPDPLVAAGAGRRRSRRRRARARPASSRSSSRRARARPLRPLAARRRAGRDRRRHARHQGRGAALHPRHPQRGGAAHPARRSLDQRQALRRRRAAARGRAPSPPRLDRPSSPATAAPRSRHGGGLRALDRAAERDRRHHLGRRLRRHRAGHAGDAGAAGRRAEGHDLDRRLRRRRPLRRRPPTS